MTLQELEDNWEEYGIDDKRRITDLKDLFSICYGKYEGGVAFDITDKIGTLTILKPDEQDDSCFVKEEDGSWRRIGKFVKL